MSLELADARQYQTKLVYILSRKLFGQSGVVGGIGSY
jgi:hypothetical protein